MFDLQKKTALVTGSSRGIGRAILLALAEQGAQVVLHCRKPCPAADETATLLEKTGARYHTVYADLSRPDGADSLYRQIETRQLEVDILFLNASVQVRKNWLELTDAEFDLQINTNIRSSLKLLQNFVPGMMKQNWGRIITIGSVQQKKPHEQMLVYSASKMAVLNTVISLASQLAPYGITVNNLAPGAIETDRNTQALSDPAYRRKVCSSIPMNYIGQPGDIAGAAVFLASQESRYMTGQDIFIDGGKSL